MKQDEAGAALSLPAESTPPLGGELTEQLRRIAAAHCEQEGGCHGPDHIDRVHRTALEIGRAMQADLKVLSAAALLHDIGRSHETRSRGRECHAAKGAALAAGILAELGFPAAQTEQIIHCIATHRYRGEAVPLSLEARILFDADKLDSIGAVGIGRAFQFAGQVGARLHNQHQDVAATSAYSAEDTAYREFMVKLRHIKDRLLTTYGRQLAGERHRFMELFFAQLEQEINGFILE